MSENCHVEPVNKDASAEELQEIEVVLLSVSGMGCQNCAARVRNSLVSLKGVVEARVDHTMGMAQVAYNPTLASADDLIAAVALAGGDGRHEYGAELAARR